MNIKAKYKKGQIVLCISNGRLMIIDGISKIEMLRPDDITDAAIEYKCMQIQGRTTEEAYISESHLILIKDALKQLKEAQ